MTDFVIPSKSSSVDYIRRRPHSTSERPELVVTDNDTQSSSQPLRLSFERPDSGAARSSTVSSESTLDLSQPISLTNSQTSTGVAKLSPSLRAKLVGQFYLGAENNKVTLNRLQSSVGSLTVSGVERFYWEVRPHTDDVEQIVYDSHTMEGARLFGIPVPSFGNQPLVEPYKAELVVGLRHVRQLRRLFIAGEGVLTVSLLNGLQIISTVEPNVREDGNYPVKNLLSVSQVDGELIIRKETLLAGIGFEAMFNI